MFKQGYAGPEMNAIRGYIGNRSTRLKKAYADHVRWEQELRETHSKVGVFTTWVDHDGENHTAIITEEYLAIHWKIVRALILDLVECGSEGRDILHRIVPANTTALSRPDPSTPTRG